MSKQHKHMKQGRNLPLKIICGFLIFLGCIALASAIWYVSIYGRIGFDAIFFTLFSDIGGVETSLVSSYILWAAVPSVILSAILWFFIFYHPVRTTDEGSRKWKFLPNRRWISLVLSVALCVTTATAAAYNVEMPQWISRLLNKTQLYENEYVSPSDVKITFPEKKRNLIYIYMESMEFSYTSKELGGGLQYNLLPNMSELAQGNINFSHSDGMGGGRNLLGSSWTIAAMVSQTAGVPLQTPPGVDGNAYGKTGIFLPGITTLNDVLHDNGYYQTLMVGSDSDFAGRRTYYATHGTDKIYDLFTAREDGIIPSDYYVWWGFEDKYLYEYAKQELTEISKGEQPFAFTMLTVDTHHLDGYVCEYCQNTYTEQYENVISCADRQVYAFVDWLKDQDFYENTTVIITGDHDTMNGAYILRNMGEEYTRRIYNCFINSAAKPSKEKNREFTTIDMFPTTLAAMGCKIEGDRLGLGTNLFSDTPTLCEEYGYDYLTSEGAKTSDLYNKFFVSDD